jgi:hypothetical protein
MTSQYRRPVCRGLLTSLLLSVMLCFAAPIQAADINATSCSQRDVQSVVNTAVNGDRVLVPPGTCTWSSGVAIPPTKGITLQGAGEGADGTTIVYNAPGSDLIFAQIGAGNAVTRITNFKFDGNSLGTGSQQGIVTIDATANALDSFRVDHITLVNPGGNGVRGIMVWAHTRDFSGLIDHFTCVKRTSKPVQCVAVDGESGINNRTSFSRPLSLGTNHAVYIEDSIFDYAGADPADGALDAYNGARYVFRHNTLIHTWLGHHGFDTGEMGVGGFEIYGNTSVNNDPGTLSFWMGWFRSGVGVIFDNTATGNMGGIALTNYRSCPGTWALCDGTFAGGDENQPAQQGYACLDQVGHQFTQALNGVNTLYGLYSWNNSKNGNPEDAGIANTCARLSLHLQYDRDVYTSVAGGGPGKGTSGVGRGTLAQRPASCVQEAGTAGPGYFATDTNTLYKCQGGSWTSYYTPYTYPHPLAGSGSALNGPTGLIVQ